MNDIFERLIKPGLDSISVLEVIHSEVHDGVKFRITQTVTRNVFNEFDRKLSDHLVATKGHGFPSCQVTVQIAGLQGNAEPKYLSPTYHDSTPHALKSVAECAFARVGPIELVIQRGDFNPGHMLPICHRRMVDSAYIAQFELALAICDHLGAAAFMDIKGEFDLVTITPPGGLDPVVLRLREGTVLVPSVLGPTNAPFEWPIAAFAEHASRNISVQSYLSSVRNAVVTQKETAILAFHLAAEQRIHEFDQALAGRHLGGHWLKGASALIARLRAGLGDTFAGISEDARGKALDWCAEIRKTQTAQRVQAQRVPSGAERTAAQLGAAV